MKKFCLFIIAALGFAAITPIFAMDADELIAKAIEASGGKEKIQSIKSMQTTGKFMAGGMEFPFTTYHLRPNMMKIEADVMGATMIQCYDGKQGWSINPMTGSSDPQKMPPLQEKAFALQADMDGPLFDWKEKGYTVEYVGTDDVEGTEVHHLKVDTKQDILMDMYFDSEYYLPLKIHTKVTDEGAQYDSDTFFSDYKEVEGMMVAHSVETRMGGQTANTILIETVTFGAEVDPATFVMPEKTKATEKE